MHGRYDDVRDPSAGPSGPVTPLMLEHLYDRSDLHRFGMTKASQLHQDNWDWEEAALAGALASAKVAKYSTWHLAVLPS